jgi:hypothetical protein
MTLNRRAYGLREPVLHHLRRRSNQPVVSATFARLRKTEFGRRDACGAANLGRSRLFRRLRAELRPTSQTDPLPDARLSQTACGWATRILPGIDRSLLRPRERNFLEVARIFLSLRWLSPPPFGLTICRTRSASFPVRHW